ncbi:MAG: geranylgeranyl reductase family protein, partial [Methylotetracoccus sp.]|nr:geranylgeranyl reductase family protein [Methylotetracoccus sp.]
MKIYDVVIVGAGPAGSALAVHLATAGYRVALLERNRFPRDKVCGDLVSARALGLLDELGCLEPVLAVLRVPIREARVFLNGRLFSAGSMPLVPGLPSHGHAVPRFLLDEIIFRRAAQAGADTVEDCRVTGFEYSSAGVVVSAIIGERPARLEGRLIVGADGAQSIVAKTARLEMRDARYLLPAVRAYVHGLSLDHAVLCFEEDFFPGYGWIFPLTDSVANIGVGMVQETMHRHGLVLKDFYRRLEAFVHRLADERGTQIRIEKSAGWIIKAYGAGRRNYFERGLLIGEAGCFVDPLTGEGIPLALATARLARQAIETAFARGDFGAASLSCFDELWRAAYEADLRVSDLVVASARNRHLLPLWMHALRVMALTAATDQDYALTLGGIMAGLVPAREGLSARILLKSLLHGPGFWMEAFGVPKDPPLASIAAMTAGGARLAEGQAELWRGVAADPAWSTRWMLELLGKEFRLARALQPRLGGATRNTRTPERIETPTQPQCCNGTAPARHPGPRRAAVLGATGHIGNAVVRELLSRGWDVTAVSRQAEPPANLAGLPVKFVRGGEHDQAGAFAAWIAGHDLVVDAAAPYPIDLFPKEEGGRKSLLDRVEARTRTLLTAFSRHGARLVYVGSFVTTPRSGDRLEGARSRALRRIHPYFAVKQLIVRRINAETQAGLESIIVNPT